MKKLTDGQNFQIATKSARLQAKGINHYCYIFVAGIDPNSVYPKDITAFGIQHATIITAHDNSEDINTKKASNLLEDQEIVMIDDQKYKVVFKGDYSDCVHFQEVV